MKKITTAELAALGGWKETTFTNRRKAYEQKLKDKGFMFVALKEGRKIYYLLEEEKTAPNLTALSLSEQIEIVLGYKAKRAAYSLKYLKFIKDNPEEFQWLTDAQVAAEIGISEKHVQAVRSELVPTYIFPNSCEYKYFFRNRSTNFSSEEITYEEYRAAQWEWTNKKHEIELELRSRMEDNTPFIFGDITIITTVDEDNLKLITKELGKAYIVEVYGGYPTRVPKKETSFGLEEQLEKLFK